MDASWKPESSSSPSPLLFSCHCGSVTHQSIRRYSPVNLRSTPRTPSGWRTAPVAQRPRSAGSLFGKLLARDFKSRGVARRPVLCRTAGLTIRSCAHGSCTFRASRLRAVRHRYTSASLTRGVPRSPQRRGGSGELLIALTPALVSSFSLAPDAGRIFGELGITLEFELADD
jgi:hypothetical protein